MIARCVHALNNNKSWERRRMILQIKLQMRQRNEDLFPKGNSISEYASTHNVNDLYCFIYIANRYTCLFDFLNINIELSYLQ